MTARGVAIGFGGALVEQLRWFWHRQWVWIAIVTVLTGGLSAWVVVSLPEEARSMIFMVFGSILHQLLVLIALSWALSVWRDDPPKERQYFWLHPAERTSHTLARTLAGFLWLMLVLVVVTATVLVAVMLLKGSNTDAGTARFWLFVVGSVALAYLAGSIAPILSDRPGLWIVAIVALVIIGSALAEMRQIEWLKSALEAVLTKGPYSFGAALGAPGYEAARILTASGQPGAADVPRLEQMGEIDPAAALGIWLVVAIGAVAGSAWASRPR